MKKRWQRMPLGMQFLSFYILILIIPVICLGAIIHFSLLANLKSQVMDQNEKKLIQMKDIIDTKLSEFHRISLQVSSQHELTPYYVNNYFDVFKAKKYLNYKVGNDFIYDLFYYIRGNDYLFSGESSYAFPYFINNYYQYENWSYEDFYREMNESNKAFLRNPEQVNIFNREPVNIITYGVPVPFNSRHPYGTLLFMVDEQIIQNMLRNVVNSSAGNAYILDDQQQVVASLYDRKSELKTFMKKSQSDDALQSITVDHELFYVSEVTSDFLDWTFFTLTPEAELMKEVNSVKMKVMFSYVFILLVGTLVIYLGMRLNYQPLQSLIRRAEKKWSAYLNQHHGLEKVWEAMQYSETENELLSKHVEDSRPILQQHLLKRLLRGELSTYEEMNTEGQDIHLKLETEEYFVLLLESKQKPIQEEEAKEWLSALSNKEKHHIDLFGHTKTLFILSGPVDQGELMDWFKSNQRLKAMDITIGVGNSYADAKQLGKSHLEAATALNYQLIKGSNQMIFFSETSAEDLNTGWYEKQVIDQLELAIRQRNREQVEHVLNEIKEVITSPQANLFLARCLMFDVSSTIMRIVQEIQPVQTQENTMMPDLLKINDFHSIEEMEEMVSKMIRRVFEMNEERLPDQQLLNDVLAYMDEHYQEYQFSVQALAEHFSLSEAYIMRYFKKQTGETILQHLNRLRMEQTKNLLTRTDIQIKEIALQVGYSDVSSFIRKFKQQENMTPGEFRKQYGKKDAI